MNYISYLIFHLLLSTLCPLFLSSM